MLTTLFAFCSYIAFVVCELWLWVTIIECDDDEVSDVILEKLAFLVDRNSVHFKPQSGAAVGKVMSRKGSICTTTPPSQSIQRQKSRAKGISRRFSRSRISVVHTLKKDVMAQLGSITGKGKGGSNAQPPRTQSTAVSVETFGSRTEAEQTSAEGKVHMAYGAPVIMSQDDTPFSNQTIAPGTAAAVAIETASASPAPGGTHEQHLSMGSQAAPHGGTREVVNHEVRHVAQLPTETEPPGQRPRVGALSGSDAACTAGTGAQAGASGGDSQPQAWEGLSTMSNLESVFEADEDIGADDAAAFAGDLQGATDANGQQTFRTYSNSSRVLRDTSQRLFSPVYRNVLRPLGKRVQRMVATDAEKTQKVHKRRLTTRILQYYDALDGSVRSAGFLTAFWCVSMLEYNVRKWVLFLACTVFLFAVLVVPHVLRSARHDVTLPPLHLPIQLPGQLHDLVKPSQ